MHHPITEQFRELMLCRWGTRRAMSNRGMLQFLDELLQRPGFSEGKAVELPTGAVNWVRLARFRDFPEFVAISAGRKRGHTRWTLKRQGEREAALITTPPQEAPEREQRVLHLTEEDMEFLKDFGSRRDISLAGAAIALLDEHAKLLPALQALIRVQVDLRTTKFNELKKAGAQFRKCDYERLRAYADENYVSFSSAIRLLIHERKALLQLMERGTIVINVPATAVAA